ncbi:MAG: HAD family phosphatase [Candidatus Omnitrophica bacterium]|nr:HAD family phosphatase [Candidatus Omnitrophota bacterium]MBU1047139.1 HAD family phosphatase [Candidatus Omnitrophota bacterium]MBU1630418.1 HAD family phosphatase [Candidatus Omnitrophota bacterium]MBU1889583.1 HAD family phosphatase [Candidatus Omnitrophota bacterium]
MSIKGIIFDVDGVIFDSEKLHAEAWKRVFEKRNVFLVDDKSGVGCSDREFLKELKEKRAIPENLNICEIQNEKLAVLIELANKKVELFPEVKELLISLKKNYILGVASNSDKNFIFNIIQNTNLLHFFESILTINDIKEPKPSPEIYLLSAQKMELKPQECVVIEDSTVGIEAAKRAGMKCIAIAHTLSKERLKKADLLLNEVSVEKIERFIQEQSCSSY